MKKFICTFSSIKFHSITLKMDMIVVLSLFFPVVFATNQVICPEDTLNAGWSVVESYAFTDPLDCCRLEKVSKWSVSETIGLSSSETGCLVGKRLAFSLLVKHIYPVLCSSHEDCGQRTSDGRGMECCPEKYCLAKSTNGTSLCHANFEDGEVETMSENRPVNGLEEMKHQCRFQKLNPCLSCETVCPSGTFQLKIENKTSVRIRRSNRRSDGIPIAIADVININNPSPGANDNSPMLGNSDITTPYIPDSPSPPPFQVPWTLKAVGNQGRIGRGITIDSTNVIPQFVSPFVSGQSGPSQPANTGSYGEQTGYNNGYNNGHGEPTGYDGSQTGYNNGYGSQTGYGTASNGPHKPAIDISPSGQPFKEEVVDDSNPAYNAHNNHGPYPGRSPSGDGPVDTSVPYEDTQMTNQVTGYDRPDSMSGTGNTGYNLATTEPTKRPRKKGSQG